MPPARGTTALPVPGAPPLIDTVKLPDTSDTYANATRPPPPAPPAPTAAAPFASMLPAPSTRRARTYTEPPAPEPGATSSSSCSSGGEPLAMILPSNCRSPSRSMLTTPPPRPPFATMLRVLFTIGPTEPPRPPHNAGRITSTTLLAESALPPFGIRLFDPASRSPASSPTPPRAPPPPARTPSAPLVLAPTGHLSLGNVWSVASLATNNDVAAILTMGATIVVRCMRRCAPDSEISVSSRNSTRSSSMAPPTANAPPAPVCNVT
mmetsp:Transcript_5844/g.9954  ORF Transcript_5844/g.9954 Transcript_5844/m.9954 type:complete len:265 (-) Transcript_5844:379-1173(-)